MKANANVISFAAKPRVRLLRSAISIGSLLAPRLTAELCLDLFLTPGRRRRPAWEEAHLKSAVVRQTAFKDRKMSIFQWGKSNRRVLLCHAWGGRGTQLGDFVPVMLAHGFEVIAFDAPAHGASDGRRTDMVEYSDAIQHVVDICGPIEAAVGHSFGAGNLMFARQRRRFPVSRIALLGCFSDGEWVIDRFAELLNVPPPTLNRMKAIHEGRHAGAVRWSQFNIVEMVRREAVPVLIVHDKTDMEIPYFHAEAFHASNAPHVTSITTDGMGHRRILRDAQVIRSVGDFIAGAV